MSKLGVTGSRRGWTSAQVSHFVRYAEHFTELHHGDCVGVDALAARRFEGRIVAHPPLNSFLRALAPSDEERQPQPYLTRNRNIVDEVDVMVAFPDGPERRRSGTWSTIRYATKVGRWCVIIYPTGEIEERNGK